MEKATIKSVGFYLQDGVEVLDFAGPMEVFAYAGFEVFTIGKTKDPIVSQGILKIIPDFGIEDAPIPDMLAFFGGNSSLPSNDPEVLEWVSRSASRVKMHFSVCTGAFILGGAGLLDNLTATTFHLQIEEMRERFPAVEVLEDTRFVDNGKVITTAGISAGIDGALHIVEKLKGLEKAQYVADLMEYDYWKPGNGLVIADNQEK